MGGSHPWVTSGHGGLRFGANLTPLSVPWPVMRATARQLEAIGFDGIFAPDHPTLFGDPWQLMAALADATEKVRLGTVVSCVAYRHPVTLARLAADVDLISNGRVMLGLGSGDIPLEFEKLGLEYGTGAQRSRRLAEALAVIMPLLAGETVTFAGEFYNVRDVSLVPRPLQAQVPILIAGGGRNALELVAKYASASNIGAASWAGGAFTPEDTSARWATLRTACAGHDRDFASVLRTGIINLKVAKTQEQAEGKVEAMPAHLRQFFQQLVVPCTPEGAAAQIQRLSDAGYQYVIFQGLDPETIELLAEHVLPRFGPPVTA